MRNWLTFGGIDSRDYGVYISGTGVFDSPEREYEVINVPGRDGDVLGVGSRLANISVTYPCFIYANFRENLRNFVSALTAVKGYADLADTYYTGEFRKAYFGGEVSVDPVGRLNAGQFELTFECKPQRYLASGQQIITLTAAGSVTNPTPFDSQPRFEITGYGTISVNGEDITILNVYPSIVIDSEVMDCYYGTTNANEQVEMESNDFPLLNPGANTITFDSTITQVKILPRWFRV